MKRGVRLLNDDEMNIKQKNIFSKVRNRSVKNCFKFSLSVGKKGTRADYGFFYVSMLQ